jgi:hypothetical protein
MIEPATTITNLSNALATIRQKIEATGYQIQITWMDEYGGEQSILLGNTDRLSVQGRDEQIYR